MRPQQHQYRKRLKSGTSGAGGCGGVSATALPNIRRRNATRRITAGQIARLHALLPHLLTHLQVVFARGEIAIGINDAAIGARIALSSTPSNPKPPDAESSRSSRERPPPKYMSE